MRENVIKDKILRVMALAMAICPPEEEDGGKKRTCVFVDYCPHINRLDVRIYKGGWRHNRPNEDYYTYYNDDEAKKAEGYLTLDEIVKKLETLAKEVGANV